MKLFCLKCKGEAIVKAGFMKEKQRYLCKNCGYQFTQTTPRGKPQKDKTLAMILYLSGLSMNMTGKIVGVTAQSIMRWIKDFYRANAETISPPAHVKEIEIDEMHHYIGKKNTLFGSGKCLTVEIETSSLGTVVLVLPKVAKPL